MDDLPWEVARWKDEAERLRAGNERIYAEIERLKHDLDSYIKAANGYLAESEFLIRLIRGEGNQDMIEQMEHFLDIKTK